MKTTGTQVYRFGIVSLLAFALLTGAFAQKPVDVEIVFTLEALQYIGAQVPNELAIPVLGKVRLKNLMGIPEDLHPAFAPRKYESETSEVFEKRRAQNEVKLQDLCTLENLGNLRKMGKSLTQGQVQLTKLNKILAKAADRCAMVTGSRVCLRIQNGVLENSEAAAKQLAENKIQFLVLPPDHYHMLSEPSVDKWGRKFEPILDPKSFACRSLPLKAPKVGKLPELPLGELFVCWKKDSLPLLVAESRDAAIAKAREGISIGIDTASSLVNTAGPDTGTLKIILGSPVATKATKQLLSGISRQVLNEAFYRLEKDVLCDPRQNDSDQAVAHAKSSRPAADVTNATPSHSRLPK